MTNPDAFPVEPRFTLESLREIRIPKGAGSTVTAFVFIHAGKKVEKYATVEDLTDQERTAALAFILEHGETVVKRKTPIRPPEPIDLSTLTIPDDI